MNNIIVKSKAHLLVRDRYDHPEGGFIEIVVWLLPKPLPPSQHLYKYSLTYVVDEERVVGFDNERGKGDHYHFDDQEFAYPFISLDILFADFAETLTRWHRGHRYI